MHSATPTPAIDFRRLAEDLPDGLLVIDEATGEVVFSNARASSLLGASPDRLDAALATPGQHAVVDLPGGTVELRVADRRHGGCLVVHLRDVSRLRSEERTLSLLNDQLQRANRRLERAADRDPLTGLLNRRGLARALAALRCDDGGCAAGALLIDVDLFKSFNSRFGHAVGDNVLASVAAGIGSACRPTDVVARIGGDEFLVLLFATDATECDDVAERIRVQIADTPVHTGDGPAIVTVSIGATRVDALSVSVDDLLRRTRRALERSKSEGRNRVATDSGIAPTAVPGGEWRILEQPIVDLRSGVVHGHEYCVKPGRDRIHDLFARSRERGCTAEVDLHCLESIAAAGVETPRCHVNVLATTLLSVGSDRVLDALSAIPSPSVCVELAARDILRLPDADGLAACIRRLRRAGVLIAVDQVGFGSSTIEPLLLYEPDIVKVDAALVSGRADVVDRERMLRRLRQLAEALGADLVAHGVESARQCRTLVSTGVRLGQGYHCGEPRLVGVRGRAASLRGIGSRVG